METRQRHIFICDDEKSVLHFLSAIFIHKGFLVSFARDGREALETLIELETSSTPVDLLITDILMPRMDGRELLNELRAAAIYIPTIAITGQGDKHMLVKLLQDGFDGYLEKPFNADEVYQYVNSVFEKVDAKRHAMQVEQEQDKNSQVCQMLDHITQELEVLVSGMDELNKHEKGFQFKETLEKLRHMLGMTKVQMAKACDIAPTHWAALEATPPTLPSPKDLYQISHYLGMSVAALVALAEQYTPHPMQEEIPPELQTLLRKFDEISASLHDLFAKLDYKE